MDFSRDQAPSRVLDATGSLTQGFGTGYILRRHNFEAEADAGCHELRSDWARHVGPVEEFGALNPVNGSFVSLCLPLCQPERLRLCAYIIEYAFIHDTVLESETSAGTDEEIIGHKNPEKGREQLKAKIALQLLETDEPCGQHILNEWKAMIRRTREDKNRAFGSLQEYVDFRLIDTGAIFTEGIMLFGLGITLTPDEVEELREVVYPCHACLGLANDYFSFDREYAEFDSSDDGKLINAVWLFMKWQGANASVAKQLVKEATNRYEAEYLARVRQYKASRRFASPKLDKYLEALSYMVSGNVYWSLNCPRYNPEFRYDINAVIARRDRDSRPTSLQSTDSSVWAAESLFAEEADRSVSSVSSAPASPSTMKFCLPESPRLDLKRVVAPFEYISSLPSKGLRDAFADALNTWISVPEQTLCGIKRIVASLHNASLMLDDIEDRSNLRRGRPTTHAVFGVSQTINSANLAINSAINESRCLSNPDSAHIVLEELEQLYIGQGYDLYWTFNDRCPSEEEYLEMVGKKTGGLFRLTSRLMFAHGSSKHIQHKTEEFVALVGTYYQIRDDYQNLNSAQYETQKGFAEDLDEGKFSFPIVHCVGAETADGCPPTRELLWGRGRDQSDRQAEAAGGSEAGLSDAEKRAVLRRLEDSGSMEYTRTTLRRLQDQIESSLGNLETAAGCKNWVMRYLLRKIWV